MTKRLLTWWLLLTLLTVLALPALAAGNTTDLLKVKDFKFYHYRTGIGCGSCPVYTAPAQDAYRVGNASCGTNGDVYVAGKEPGGWLLVRYETNGGNVRVGYIPPNYVRGFSLGSDHDYARNNLDSYIPCLADDSISLTDNPMNRGSAFAVIQPGETFWILATYTYHNNWWYVECRINGRPARGFIDRDAARFSLAAGEAVDPVNARYPELSPRYTRLMGMVTVTAGPTIVRKDADPATDMMGRVQASDVYPYYDVKTGSTGRLWYYIYVFDQNAWGWVSGQRVRVN